MTIHKVEPKLLTEDYIIFNKPLYLNEVEIQTEQENIVLSECMPIFNEKLKWLNSDECKDNLIDKFYKFVNSYSEKKITVEEITNNKWYENLEPQGAIIYIPSDFNKMRFTIHCVDKWHNLYVEIEDNKIISVDDEYVDPEHGLGYNGIWK